MPWASSPRGCMATRTPRSGRPSSMALMRFTNSGTEASLLALAAAKAFTARPRIMVFDGAYHGGLLSFGRGGWPINVPHEYVVAPYNDLAAAEALVREHGQTLAAIIVEPMLGAGGCIPGEPAFLHGLSELASGCGALLVFDEVQTSRLSIGGGGGGTARPPPPPPG